MMGMGAAPLPAALLAAQDSLFVLKAAQGNAAEIASGQLAVTKAQSDQVRQLAQRLVTEHSMANEQLTPLGARNGVLLPKEPGLMHRATMQHLQGLSGAEFDRAFLTAQMESHEAAITLYNQEIMYGRDPQVRSYAQSVLPHIIAHTMAIYSLARTMNAPGAADRPVSLLSGSGAMGGHGMMGGAGMGTTAGAGMSGGTGAGSGRTGGTGTSGGYTGGASGTGTGTHGGGTGGHTGGTGTSSAGGTSGGASGTGTGTSGGGTGGTSGGGAGYSGGTGTGSSGSSTGTSGGR
jgi:putative membrane protein